MKTNELLPLGLENESSTKWYHLEHFDAVNLLKSNVSFGLSNTEIASRKRQFGENKILEQTGQSIWKLLFHQFESTLVIVLLIASAVAFFASNLKDTLAILAIVFINAILGFVQEIRAERSIQSLRKLAVPKVRVRRNQVISEIASTELVPGDIVLIEAGNLIPADGRIVESATLKIQEAVLTGESEAVLKQSAFISRNGIIPLGDQINMAFMGTSVTHGRGQMLITATGMRTELGIIANLLQGVGQVKTPLQLRLNRLGNLLALLSMVVVCAIFGFGVLQGEDWRLMFMTSVSMAVAIIPEGLPAVVTIALALGAQRMLRRKALIRRLPAVETLGSVTVICSDKTGTLTENRMTVTAVDLAGHHLNILEDLKGRMPYVAIDQGSEITLTKNEPSLALLLMGGALCSDAELQQDPAHPNHFKTTGDPTEGALVIAAAKYGLFKNRLDHAYPRISEVPFDSDRKRMTTIHTIADCTAWISQCSELNSNHSLIFTKGATDSLIKVCSHIWHNGNIVPLDKEWTSRILQANEKLAQDGMRVISVAFRTKDLSDYSLDSSNAPLLETDLIFIGLFGILDPPRPEVREAVALCKLAGIRPVMITGDHPITAARIAKDLGILAEEKVITGTELEEKTKEQLEALAEHVSVYARVAPSQKLDIVEALQRKGQVVAMTGDGVNDAPALRRADIGVAMGITGTDVSKEAASMILLDDNFTTIVAAIEEGRTINDNIRRFLVFSLAGNLGKVLLVFLTPLLGMPLPLLPFQILWLNLVTDGFLGLGMSVEPSEKEVMTRPPQSPSAGILSGGIGFRIIWIGVALGALNLAVALIAYTYHPLVWQSMVMTTIVLLQMVESHVSRSWSASVFSMSPFSNKALLSLTVIIFVAQGLVLYVPMLSSLFGTHPLSLEQLLIPVAAAMVFLIFVEFIKWMRRLKINTSKVQ